MSVVTWYSAIISTVVALHTLGVYKMVGRWWRGEPLQGEAEWEGRVKAVEERLEKEMEEWRVEREELEKGSSRLWTSRLRVL